jgi:DNA (cytosine-5)-methyltransferase 1
MTKLKVLDLFSGIGGFSLGLERTGGFETVAFCEINEFSQQVLKKHWPAVEVFPDVTNLKFRKNVDLVTAGFPCQDASHAGEGAGITGERTGLYWYILRTLCMVGRPRALLENVAGLLGRGFGVVLGSMASFGYDTEWHCIPAAEVTLPHERDRVWIIANAQREGWERPITDDRIFGGKRETHPLAGDPDAARKFALAVSEQCIRGRDGVSVQSHRDRIEALGNAVVPQIPEIIGHAILAAEAA